MSDITQLPETGFLRLKTVLTFFPVSKSAWYDGVVKGKYPAPVKLGERTSAWRAEDIHQLIEATGNPATNCKPELDRLTTR